MQPKYYEIRGSGTNSTTCFYNVLAAWPAVNLIISRNSIVEAQGENIYYSFPMLCDIRWQLWYMTFECTTHLPDISSCTQLPILVHEGEQYERYITYLYDRNYIPPLLLLASNLRFVHQGHDWFGILPTKPMIISWLVVKYMSSSGDKLIPLFCL